MPFKSKWQISCAKNLCLARLARQKKRLLETGDVKIEDTDFEFDQQQDLNMIPIKTEVKLEEIFDVKQEEPDLELDHNELYKDITVPQQVVNTNVEVEIPRKQQYRQRCAVCNQSKSRQNVKFVTIDTERLLVVLGAVFGKMMTVEEARLCLNRMTPCIHICKHHFGEACHAFFTVLRAEKPSDIYSVPMDPNVYSTVKSIWGGYMTPLELRHLLILFTDKYQQVSRVAPKEEPIIREKKKPMRRPRQEVLAGPHCKISRTLVSGPELTVPKTEQETEQKPTDLVVKQEDFKQKPGGPNPNKDEVCCFCSIRAACRTMFKVPRSEESLTTWRQKLGPEFDKNLNGDVDHYICRTHLSGARGRIITPKNETPNF